MAVDLLRNRDPTSGLGSFDGKVAALAELRGENYFITTNVDYVPTLPSLKLPHALYLRSDMRYGTDDPTLWPQQWTERYCHLPLISRKGLRDGFDVMWWDPLPEDFVVGSTITHGLGRLHHRHIARFMPLVNKLVEDCEEYKRNAKAPPPSLLGELIQYMLLVIEQLQSLPTTFSKMTFSVTSLQRAFLELDALYLYMTEYKPRMENFMAAPAPGASIIASLSAFTTVPAVAQRLWCARIPFWFLRPTHVFDAENILAVVPLTEPTHIVPDIPYAKAPPVIYSGNSTTEKIDAIHRALTHTRWYRDPFELPDRLPSESRSPDISAPSPLIPAVLVASGSNPATEPTNLRFSPYPAKAVSKTPSKNTASSANAPRKKAATKTARDKFSTLTMEGMPPYIVAWAEALAHVDQSVTPFSSDPADRRYVLPEPALLVNTTPERRCKFLHHWNLLSDGFLFTLSQPEHTQPLSNQEWRDILEGHLTSRGSTGRTHKRSVGLEDRIRPALDACNLSSLEGFPVPSESVPVFSVSRTQEIVWEVAETGFRFEFSALDKRASKKDQLDYVKRCFAGGMLMGAPLALSKCGWASTDIRERQRYIIRTATLMLDWTTKSPLPNIIRRVADRHIWDGPELEALESAVCGYYTQAFWEYFGRAAVLPMRLEHDVEKEDGEI
ncbi:hypothetical protein C8J57DRAFT_1732738 [Mycena rebaudengoi]|nr:hypothetical protein C8J57DRAFT_1732738 [Mycena rebaudengoi]